ncbi:phage antirepressor [Ruminococcus callidus]|uniref:phage antirepressor n=1 Tax=Ruminococcus callidus TaxID=40519 RepID=UPI00351FAEB2
MNTNLQTWSYENSEIRTIQKDGEPWWVLSDVCKVLELTTPARVAGRLEDDEKGVSLIHTLGGKQNVTVINESGLYSVILRSDKPQAKPFRRWVTSEVLPSIRKHGAYMTDQTLEQALTSPDFLIQLATQLKEEKEQRKQLEVKVEQDKPKVLFADSVSASKSSILVGELAKILKQNGVDTGQFRLFAWLRENGYLIKREGSDYNMPTQRSVEMGLFEVKQTIITHSDGHITTNKTPKVTGKGQVYFVNKLMSKRN